MTSHRPQTILFPVSILTFLAAWVFVCCHTKRPEPEDASEQPVMEDSIGESVAQHLREVFSDTTEKWYAVDSYSLCDSAKTRSDEEMLNPYKKWVTYDTIVSRIGDSTRISFDFVADCCLDFLGKMELHSDSLLLKYGYAYDEVTPCDCYCQYRMIYRFPRRKWKVLTIENIDGQKPFR